MVINERKLALPRYYAVRDLQKIVCTTQRAGSASMIEALRPAYDDSPVELLPLEDLHDLKASGWPVLLWIRNPFERFASAYAIFGKGRIPASQTVPKYRTPDRFVECVLAANDAHWAPMIALHTHKRVFLPTEILPFEALQETWERELPGYKLAHLNRTERLRWDDIRPEMSESAFRRLEKHYAHDINLHRLALERERDRAT